ncbi:MAG: hypothetical protein K8S97_08120 [Anaerolineae bacterium]|nr:hypothetical protein [Anaerolineae bacterium]
MIVELINDKLRAKVVESLGTDPNYTFYFGDYEVDVWTNVMGIDPCEIEDLVYFRLDTLDIW